MRTFTVGTRHDRTIFGLVRTPQMTQRLEVYIYIVMSVCLIVLMIVLLIYCVLSIFVILINIILVMSDVYYYYYLYSFYVATLCIERVT